MDRTKEIEDRIDKINIEKLEVCSRGNDLWEEKINLANEYRELTGKEII